MITAALALFGLLGGGGVLFAMFGLGMPLAEIIKLVREFVAGVFKFLSTPVGQAVGILLLCAVSIVIGINYEAKKAAAREAVHIAKINKDWQAKVDAAAEKFRAERINRDRAVDQTIAQMVSVQTTEISTRAAALQKQVETYAKIAHKNCVLGPADLAGGLPHK